MRTLLADARRGHRGLYGLAVGMAGLAVVTAVLAVVDDRVLLGAPLWLKPLKFSISFVLYAGTLAWLLGQLRERALQRSGWVIVVASVIEMAVIVGQAARGVRSHYNDDTLADNMLWNLMGATIVVLWFATLAVALRFLRERVGGVDGADGADGGRPLDLAVRLGLGIALLGMAEAFLMAIPRAHAVGVADGGPGLPLLGWSTTGGDLRIGHFVGMHALQLLPLLAAGLAVLSGRWRDRLDETARTRIVGVVGTAYAAVVVLVTWQALRGQPLIAPDVWTLGAAAAIGLGTAAGLAWALPQGRIAVPAGRAGR
ncbi:hypothetical protein [Pseudonocardia sp.]|uniref:hypothetical protein n=1 Tax=Pseudonocardia sp. TaxID=60912 RepID=UPI003D10C808